MQNLLINIHSLWGIDEKANRLLKGDNLNKVESISNAWLLVEDDKIKDYGTMSEISDFFGAKITDLTGMSMLPAFVDSHTHLVFAKNREQEFEDRLNGLTYQEIALKGGGILNSARMLREMDEDELFEISELRLKRLISMGTGALEIKSGYGLSTQSELKMLRVIKRLKEKFKIPVKATLLAAHAFPDEFKDNKQGYIDLIINEILPQATNAGLVDYFDVFCETGYFDVPQTVQLLQAAASYGLHAKIHVNQFSSIGGIEAAVKHKAISVDHLEIVTENDIENLKNSSCVVTALPGCSFFLGIPYTPVKELIKQNIAINLASDYNPGSTPSGNMQLVMSLACIKQKLTPAQAFNACTLNAAAALELSHVCGSISKGKLANLMVTEAFDSLAWLPYNYGENKVKKMMIAGSWYSL